MNDEADRTRDDHRSPVASILTLWGRTLRIAYLRFGFSVSVLMAAGIAFFSLLCLAPLGILIAAILRSVFGTSGRAYQWISEAVNALGAETAGRVMPQIDGLLSDPGSYVTSVVSAIILVWASMRLFEVTERALTDVWPGKVLRTYLKRKAVALVMLIVAGLMLSSFVLLTAFLASAQGWLQRLQVADPDMVEQLRPQFLWLYQFILAAVAFWLLYKFMPVQKVATRVAAVGAFSAAILWQVASAALSQMIRHSASESSFYGGLTGIIVFSLWCFLGAEMLLFGGHLAVAYEHVFIRRRPPEEDDELIAWPRRHGKVTLGD